MSKNKNMIRVKNSNRSIEVRIGWNHHWGCCECYTKNESRCERGKARQCVCVDVCLERENSGRERFQLFML